MFSLFSIETQQEDFDCSVTDGTITITGYTGPRAP